MFRGGAYKPRTSAPTPSRASAQEGLRLLAEAKEQTGLPIVTELMDARDLEPVLEVADVIQIGARNMQNYSLLTEVGRSGCPVLIKRGLSSTLEELLMAAEYVLKEGNEHVMLCERGIRTFETAYRFTLDLTAVPVLKELTHLPVDRRPEPRRGPPRRSSSRCRSPPPRSAPTASSSRSTRSPRRRSATGRRQLRTEASPTTRPACERGRRGRGQGPPPSSRPLDASRSSGVGLIGGSVGLAARERARRARRRAGDPDAPTRALARGAIDAAVATSATRSTAPTSPFVAAPVDVARRARWPTVARAGAAAPASSPTSARPSARSSTRRDDPRFVGGHPLAGSEAAGVEHARGDLFDGATWYLTPTATTAGMLLERLHRLLTGARRAARGDRRRRPRPR